MAKKKRKPRVTYREHSDELIQNAIRAAVPEGSILWDYFSEIVTERVEGATEFERGIHEGFRRLADNLLTIAMSKPIPKVQIEGEEDAT